MDPQANRLEFGVTYHPAYVSRLCKAIRWNPQKPTQRDEAATAYWRQETWPGIKKGRRSNIEASSS
jgi:transposase